MSTLPPESSIPFAVPPAGAPAIDRLDRIHPHFLRVCPGLREIENNPLYLRAVYLRRRGWRDHMKTPLTISRSWLLWASGLLLIMANVGWVFLPAGLRRFQGEFRFACFGVFFVVSFIIFAMRRNKKITGNPYFQDIFQGYTPEMMEALYLTPIAPRDLALGHISRYLTRRSLLWGSGVFLAILAIIALFLYHTYPFYALVTLPMISPSLAVLHYYTQRGALQVQLQHLLNRLRQSLSPKFIRLEANQYKSENSVRPMVTLVVMLLGVVICGIYILLCGQHEINPGWTMIILAHVGLNLFAILGIVMLLRPPAYLDRNLAHCGWLYRAALEAAVLGEVDFATGEAIANSEIQLSSSSTYPHAPQA